MATLFDTVENTQSLHEPKPDLLELANNYVTGKISLNKTADELFISRQYVRQQIIKPGTDKYIESNNRLFSLIPVVRQVFAGAKIIHIIRDGRDVVRSGMGRGWYDDIDPFPRIRATDFSDDPYNSKWKDMTRFEKICWWWQKKDGIIRDSTYDTDYSIRVKFEDIFDREKGIDNINIMADFLGFPEKFSPEIFENKVNVTKKFDFPDKNDWDSKYIETFSRIAGDLFKEYGYFYEY